MLPASGRGTDRPSHPRAIARGKHHGGHVEANRGDDNAAAPPLALDVAQRKAEIYGQGFGWRRSSAHSLAAISRLREHSGCHRKRVWKVDHTELSEGLVGIHGQERSIEMLSAIQSRVSLHDGVNQARVYY